VSQTKYWQTAGEVVDEPFRSGVSQAVSTVVQPFSDVLLSISGSSVVDIVKKNVIQSQHGRLLKLLSQMR